MLIEDWKQIKKENPRILEKLKKENLRNAWFICYHITLDVQTAAPMLLTAWEHTLLDLIDRKSAPKEGFLELFSSQVFQLSQEKWESDETFAVLKPPQVNPSYRIFTTQIDKLEQKKRIAYLLYTFGDMSSAKLAKAMQLSPEEGKAFIQEASSEIMDHIKSKRKGSDTALITLSTEFRSADGKGLSGVQVPPFLTASLEHKLANRFEIQPKSTGKETKPMSQLNTNSSNKKRVAKLRKRIITIAIVVVVVLAAVFGVWRLAQRNTATATIVTTYYTEAITYGDVDTTVSGSSTLTPVDNEYLIAENSCTIDTLNYAVGDTVEEGDVIAVITETITEQTVNETTMEISETTTEEETEITAPCDGLLTELPVAEGDSLEANEEIGIVMGTENGFTVSLSVDETEIANMAIGQEVTVTVDAVDGEYTGEVTNLSYNGTTSGSSVAYQITAGIDYEEGLYSGMSATVEIVIESSGDGLLVPVDAVHTSGDDSYVYLAPDDAEEGTEYEEEEIDLDDLTQVTVTTDMSDGSYIMIESDELAEGDLILMTEVSTTATASDDDDTTNGFGGMGGGMGGNMDFGDMDFGDMDFSNMPAGGMGGAQ